MDEAAEADGTGGAGVAASGAAGSTFNSVSGHAVVSGLVMAERIGALTINPQSPRELPIPRQVPLPRGVFVNRVRELAGLRASAGRPAGGRGGSSIVAVTGLSGVGKTELVAQWVHRDLRESYPDGQLYVDLDDFRRDGVVDVTGVLAGFLRALRPDGAPVPDHPAACAAQFRSEAAGRALLVVADNARQAPEVRPLVPPDGLLVVTSRTWLPALRLDGAAQITVDPLDEAAGVALVRNWQVTAAEGTAAELVRLCGGLPFALRAAGEWLAGRPHLGLDAVVRALTAQGQGPGGEIEGVGVVLDAVLAELPEHSRALYRLIGCLPGNTVTVAVAEAAGAPRVDDAFGDLVTAHLAQLTEARSGPRRFRMNDAVRSHARQAAAALPEAGRTAALRRVVDFYVEAVAHADAVVLHTRFRIQPPPSRTMAQLSPSGPLFGDIGEALDWLDAERANVLAVLRAASKQRWYDAVWRLCESLWALYHSRGHYADAVEAHLLGIEAARWEGRGDAEVRMRNQLARMHYELAEYDEARGQLAAASELLPAVRDPRLAGVVRETQGLIALRLGRPREAVGLFREALRANEGDEHGMVVQAYQVGQALVASGDASGALDVLEGAARRAEATGDLAMRPRIGIVTARALDALGRTDEAVATAVTAAERAHALRLTAKLDQALDLLARLAERADEAVLRERAAGKLRELRQVGDGGQTGAPG
ncbi:tetratricopeptide repeat protein [Streptomyces montanisoli]|uniref:tetratricopeptide repeat protein n=1 Tax=Streptomyces montanisoli TaxID=2798581 RepID=UPI0027DBD9C0|nr:tetratricopeptide repeat protein [Streptomyces montanisoli]